MNKNLGEYSNSKCVIVLPSDNLRSLAILIYVILESSGSIKKSCTLNSGFNRVSRNYYLDLGDLLNDVILSKLEVCFVLLAKFEFCC